MAKVLIYGASGGIGSTLARVLAREGYDLYLSGRDAARLSSLAQELGAGFTVADVEDAESFPRVSAAAGDRLDGLVYAVGSINLRPLLRLLEIGSCTELAREVGKRGIRTPRGNLVDKKYIYRMLSNRAYIGEAVHKGDSYPGEHDAIIDQETWNKVHAILTESPRKRAARTRADTPALLKGLLYGPDGAAFSPTHTRKGGRLYRYYVSQTVLKHGAGSCPVGRVPAGEIEAAVIDQLRAVFRQPEIVAGTWKAARAQDGDITETDAREALQRLDPLWDELFPAEQARIVALLAERVEIGAEGLNVRLRMDGLAGLAREMATDIGAAA